MKRIALLLTGLAVVPAAAATEPSITYSTAVLAVAGGNDGSAKLAWLEPRTLKQLKRGSVELGDAQGAVFSPSATKIAVGSSAFGIRVVDVRRMKLTATGMGRRLGWYLDPVSWPTARRILAIERHQRLPSTRLVVIDPVARRVLKRALLDPHFERWKTAGRELVALASPAEGIGPARVVLVDPNGALRAATLERIPAGGRAEGAEKDPTYTLASPGLALDVAGRKAYVVGKARLLAEVDLDSLAVTYRELSPSRAPAARQKVVTGWTRQATWLGGGRIAVAGTEYDELRSTPAGLEVIDVRTGASRVVEARAGFAIAASGMVLAGGVQRDGATAAERGMGIGAFSAAGDELWRALADEPVWWAQEAGGYAYVVGPEAYPLTVRVIDLADGTVRTVRGQMPYFVTR